MILVDSTVIGSLFYFQVLILIPNVGFSPTDGTQASRLRRKIVESFCRAPLSWYTQAGRLRSSPFRTLFTFGTTSISVRFF
jgi:hypothetical protein